MREARSYSIVDHALLHDGHLGKLPHAALSLYLFLVVVGDRDGRSFYGGASVCEILRLGGRELGAARAELIRAGLIRYRRPYWWVESLTRAKSPAPIRCPESRPSCPAPVSIHRVVPDALRELIRSLEERL